MVGIISYKDLERWDEVFPSKVQKAHQRVCGYKYPTGGNTQYLSEFIITGDSFQNLISSEEEDHGWYILLLGNLNYETKALKLVLENYHYLNLRTSDVRFFMPGFEVRRDGIEASEGLSHKDQFKFYDEGFIETVCWLEVGNPDYKYSENMEMVLLPFKKGMRETVYDFRHMLSYNLDAILTKGKNINDFITRAIAVVKRKMSFEETRVQMEGEEKLLQSKPRHQVFIAGSTYLEKERDSIRSEFSKLTNKGGTIFQTWTFEDFGRSFTPEGRQEEYNSFIRNEADSVIFVLSNEVHTFTNNEFKIAMDSFINNGHPKINVYNFKANEEVVSPEIQSILDEINNNNQYYTEYTSLHDLKNQVFKDFIEIALIPR